MSVLTGADHRGPNQTRHTFASMLITNFVNLDIVASLLDHSSIKILQEHYGKIIPSDRPNEAKIISKLMVLDYAYYRE